jgi:hypothetical protein
MRGTVVFIVSVGVNNSIHVEVANSEQNKHSLVFPSRERSYGRARAPQPTLAIAIRHSLSNELAARRTLCQFEVPPRARRGRARSMGFVAIRELFTNGVSRSISSPELGLEPDLCDEETWRDCAANHAHYECQLLRDLAIQEKRLQMGHFV